MKKSNSKVKKFVKSFFAAFNMTEVEKAIEDLTLFNSMVKQSMELKSLLVSPLFKDSEKIKALDAITLKLKLARKSEMLIKKGVEEKIISHLSLIIDNLNSLYLEANKRSEAVVLSSARLDEELDVKLKESLSSILDREVDLTYEIDSSLMGGIIIKVGSIMFDSSLKGQLNLIRDEMLRKRMN